MVLTPMVRTQINPFPSHKNTNTKKQQQQQTNCGEFVLFVIFIQLINGHVIVKHCLRM